MGQSFGTQGVETGISRGAEFHPQSVEVLGGGGAEERLGAGAHGHRAHELGGEVTLQRGGLVVVGVFSTQEGGCEGPS